MEGLEAFGEIVGSEKRIELLAKLLMGLLVIRIDRGVLQCAVHALDLPIRAGMIRLCKPMINAITFAYTHKWMPEISGGHPVSVLGKRCKLDTIDDIVKPQLVINKSKKLKKHEILQMVGTLSSEKSCYCISSNEEIDGKQTTIGNALSCCIGYGMPSIIIIGEKVAIIESEQVYGAAYKYIMYADSNRPYERLDA